MMGGLSGGLTPSRTDVPPAGEIDGVRDAVATWLADNGFEGFEVAEVMTFTSNDYIAVRDQAGKDAFELISSPASGWLTEEPQSMMWNTRFGMMGPVGGAWSGGGMMGGGMMSGGWDGWATGGVTTVGSIEEAITTADEWLAQVRPGEQAEDHGRAFPGYFTIDTTRDGEMAGMVSVNAGTGAVWYHGWHGRFLAEQDY
jgi:hypothetical protein